MHCDEVTIINVKCTVILFFLMARKKAVRVLLICTASPPAENAFLFNGKSPGWPDKRGKKIGEKNFKKNFNCKKNV